MEESAGSADREMSIVEQSITFKLNALKETWTGTLQHLLDRGSLGSTIDSLTKLSEAIGFVVDKLGLLGTVSAGVGLFTGVKNIGLLQTVTKMDEGIERTKIVTSLKAKQMSQEAMLNSILNEQAIALEKDKIALTNLETKVASGITFEQAYAESMMTASAAAQEHAIQTKGAAGATNIFIAKEKEAQTAINATATASKGAALATKALAVAGNMVAFSLIVKGIELAATAISNFIHRNEILIQKSQEAAENIKSLGEEFSNISKTVNESSERFAQLAQGVDELTGENLNLNTTDYEEFLDLSNQLADMFPSLSRYYDENGNAIVNLSGDVNTIIASLQDLVETERLVANQKIADELPTLYEGIKVQSDEYELRLQSLEAQRDAYVKRSEELNKTIEETDISFGNNSIIIKENNLDKLSETLALFETSLMETGIKFEEKGLEGWDNGVEFVITDSEKNVEEAFDILKKACNDRIKELNTDIEAVTTSNKSNWNGLSQSIASWLQTDSDYMALSDEMRAIVQNSINNLDWTSLNFDGWDGAQKWVQDNVLSLFKTLKGTDTLEEIKLTLDLQTQFNSGEIDVGTYQKQVKALLTLIEGLDEETQKSIKLLFGIETDEEGNNSSNVDTMINNVGSKLQDKDKNKVEKLSYDDLKIASEQLEVSDGVLLTWDELLAKIEEVKNQKLDETTLFSFEEAFNADEFSDTKNKLLELAKSGEITSSVLESTDEYKTLLTQTGLSAEAAKSKILEMLTVDEKLNAASQGIGKLATAYDEFKDKGFVTISTLQSLPDSFKELKGYDAFKDIVGNAKSSSKEIQKAFDEIVTAYIADQQTLSGLTSENKDFYITQLKEMGVANASECVTEYMNNQQKLLQMEQDFINYCNKKGEVSSEWLKNEASKSGTLANSLATTYGSDYDNWCNLLTQKAQAYNAFMSAIAAASKSSWVKLNNATGKVNSSKAKSGSLSYSDLMAAGYDTATAQNIMNQQAASNSAIASAKEAMDVLSFDAVKVDTNFGGNFSPKLSGSGSKGSSGGSSSNSKEEIDWIERKLKRLQSVIDATAAKFDNLFTLKSKKNNIKAQIKETNNLLTATQKAAKLYQKDANKYAKKSGLSKSLIKKVQSGAYDITDYSSSTAEKINTYKDLWDKAQDSKQQVDELKTSVRELREEFYQLYVDEADSKIELLDAKIENTGSTDTKNKYLRDEIKYIKQSYKYQIAIAKVNKDTILQKKLEAELQTKLNENLIERLQNRVDSYNASIELYEAKANNVATYKTKNKFLEEERKYLKKSYDHQIQIAKANKDVTEQKRLQAELQTKLNDLSKTEFDNIVAYYDKRSSIESNKKEALQNQIDLTEVQGLDIGSALYKKQIGINNSDLERRVKERESLIKSLKKIDKYSDEWYDAREAIFAVDSEIANLQKENIELQKTVNQLDFDRFDDLLSKLQAINDEGDFLIDLLSEEDLFDDNGKTTDFGLASMGINAEAYDVAMSQANKYTEQIKSLKEQLTNGTITQDQYNEQLEKCVSGQQEAIKSAIAYKNAIVDLVEDGLNKERDALAENIEMQKEKLESEKDLHDFQDSINDKNKTIADLTKQINALETDDSEENRKRLQQLKSQLQDAKDDLSDTMYDRSISDQEDALDKMLKSFDEDMEKYLSNTDQVFLDVITKVNVNSTNVGNSMLEIAKKYGYTIQTDITNAWTEAESAVTDYSKTFEESSSGVIVMINQITDAWKTATKQAEEYAKAIKEATVGGYDEYGTGSSGTTNGSTSSGTGSGSGSGGTTSGGSTTSKPTTSVSSVISKDAKNYITKNATKAKNPKSKYSDLNKYIYEKTGGKVLSKVKMYELSKILRVNVSSKDITDEDNRKILAALKAARFSSGGIIDAKHVKAVGEDGVALVRHGEAILTERQTEMLKSLTKSLNEVRYDNSNSSFTKTQLSSPIYNIDSSINVDGVATNEIVNQMQTVATQQAENVIAKINKATYSKGVRR